MTPIWEPQKEKPKKEKPKKESKIVPQTHAEGISFDLDFGGDDGNDELDDGLFSKSKGKDNTNSENKEGDDVMDLFTQFKVNKNDKEESAEDILKFLMKKAHVDEE